MNNLTRSLAMLMAFSSAALTVNGQSCIDPVACNYDSAAGTPDVACIELEAFATHDEGVLAGMTTWRVYFRSTDPADFVTAVFGNEDSPLSLTTTTTFYQDALGGPTAESLNPVLLELGIAPELEFDSYVTIGLTQQANSSVGENGVSTAYSPNQNWIGDFEPGSGASGGDILMDDEVGGLWFIYNGDSNGFPDADGRVLLAQLTTSGDIGGVLNVQYFPAGGEASTLTLSLDNPCELGSIDDCTYPDAYEDCEGNCLNDIDGDLICDEEDDCVGTLDAIGVCNGNCAADADSDGLCDDVDDCIGQVDECGVCNGNGPAGDCGCEDIPDGDCDCAGNQLDALGVCGGDCPSDDNENGICDLDEDSGCADEEACNYDPMAEPAGDDEDDDYCLITEVVAAHTEGELAGLTTYRVSIQTLHPTDFVTSVSGNSILPTRIQTTTSFYQNMLGGATPANLNPLLISAFPNLAYDSWITIGLDGPANLADGETNASTVESPDQAWSSQFDPGNGLPGSDIIMDDLVGGVWYVLNGDVNGIPDEDGRVLLGQFTTDGDLFGNMQVQLFPQGDNINYILLDLPLGMGVGCTPGEGEDACLYDDAVGNCGGDCTADLDADGICDDEDDCVGVVDACGVCNGAGAIYDCGCSDIPDGDCDCDGNQLDAIGVCGGSCSADVDSDGICDDVEPQTCDDPDACNYDPNALPFVPTPADEGYCMELRVVEEHVSGDLAGMTTYRILLHTENPDDFVSSAYGNQNEPLDVSTTTSFYQNELGGLTPDALNPILLSAYPDLAYDSWVTIGLDGPADPAAGENPTATVQSPAQSWTTAFEPGFGAPGGDLVMNDPVGGVWYILNGNANGLPDADGTVLLGQFTTDGELSGTINVQIFP